MLTLQSRHRLDIRFRHFAYALAASALASDPDRQAARVTASWSPAGEGIACRSVRSGFHLMLEAAGFPAGSEVLVSAVTHPDMVRILEAHGLRAVPVDLELATLAPRLDLAARLLTPETRAMLIAHLFGGRVDMNQPAAFATRHGLLLWEDCAQAFSGPRDTASSGADVSMYSFGALKSCTAIGGALLKVKDRSLLERMQSLQASWPLQRRRTYAANVLKFWAFSLVTRPIAYGLLAWLHGIVQRDFDRLVNSSVRAFRQGQLLPQLEVRPSAPLLATLAHRLRTFDDMRLRRRTASGDWLAAHLPDHLRVPGARMEHHTYWLFPVLTAEPEQLISACRRAGFDAARGASSVSAMAAPTDRPESEPRTARRMMQALVFVPAYPELPQGSLERIAAAAMVTTPVGNTPAEARPAGAQV